MNRAERTTRRLAAVSMAGAAVLAIAGFTMLGSIFDYPKILKKPTAEILAHYRPHEGAIVGWFAVLVISAALLAPVGLLLGRLASREVGRWIAGVGVAAAFVQVIGLSRWLLFVPSISDDAKNPAHTTSAEHTFRLLHTWFGTILGETIGYALTSTFTVLVVLGITRWIAPGWLSAVGFGSAALIATGLLVPLGGEVSTMASVANFAGYVAWCLWLIAMAVRLWTLRPKCCSQRAQHAGVAQGVRLDVLKTEELSDAGVIRSS